jgi:hypothetical protein
MTRFSSHSIAPLPAGVVSLMLSACAAHPAPKLDPRLVPPNAPVASAEHVLLDETFESYGLPTATSLSFVIVQRDN